MEVGLKVDGSAAYACFVGFAGVVLMRFGGGVDDDDFVDIGGHLFGGGIEEDDVACRSGFGEGVLVPGPEVAGAGVGDALDVLPEVSRFGVGGGGGEGFCEFNGARVPKSGGVGEGFVVLGEFLSEEVAYQA